LALLDVGCGNGEFLEVATQCGWKVVGVDPDPKAVAKAKELGLEVCQGGVEVFQGKQALFNFISLSHVIEHVHGPLELLKACFDLLCIGGTLWIETPNIKSFGHSIYRQSWRGIEAPRHLVLFNEYSLRKALEGSGFVGVRRCSCQSACPSVFKASYAIQKGFSPYTKLRLPAPMGLSLLRVMLKEAVMPARHEFLTVCAVKL
jgi:SAM-dependent methyltransferase